jgi:hypothetical protein
MAIIQSACSTISQAARQHPAQHLERLPSLAHEHEERSRARLAAHALSHHGPEPLDAEPHVYRLDRDEDLDPNRQHQRKRCMNPTWRRLARGGVRGA